MKTRDKLNKGRIIFTLLLVLYAVTIVLTSLTYDPKVRFVPLMVAVILILLGIPVLLNEIFTLRLMTRLDEMELINIKKNGQKRSQGKETQPTAKKVFELLGWIFGFFALVFFVGFYISIAVYVFLFLRYRGGVRWEKTLLLTAIIWVVIFLIFDIGMGFKLFEGMFFGEIIPSL